MNFDTSHVAVRKNVAGLCASVWNGDTQAVSVKGQDSSRKLSGATTKERSADCV